MIKFGLVGKKLSHSFSPEYFNQKFSDLNLKGMVYDAYEIEHIDDVTALKSRNDICGLNVTIPYKELILPFIDEISDVAYTIGAVNTIDINEGKWIGHNTDYLGFLDLLEIAMRSNGTIQRAMILGSGGASKAVQYALETKKISFITVGRTGKYTYDNISDEVIKRSTLIINTTPLGMYPHTAEYPAINYSKIGPGHSCIDLIYNPKKTVFLERCEQQGASIHNGLHMLISQAEHAWNIWNAKLTEEENNGRLCATTVTQL